MSNGTCRAKKASSCLSRPFYPLQDVCKSILPAAIREELAKPGWQSEFGLAVNILGKEACCPLSVQSCWEPNTLHSTSYHAS